MIQEHNIKDVKMIEYLKIYYHVILNKSILSKGGTLIIVDKKLPSTFGHSYMHPTSRLSTTILNIFDAKLYLVNVYAPSGSNKEREREEFFSTELIQSLICNTDNVILAGDWNCILCPKDSSKPESTPLSTALKGIMTSFKFKDIISAKKSSPEYTYYRKEYAARLDRIYVSKLFHNIFNSATKSTGFSDHLYVSVEFEISLDIHIGRPIWKLNVSLLKNNLIKANFAILWAHLHQRKPSFPNIVDWWDELVKPNLKKFYIQQGRENKKFQYGLINYLEIQLRKEYEIANHTGVTNFDEIKSITAEINLHREKIAIGIKIRSRVQDCLANETISKYLIAKQKEIAQKKIIHTMEDNNGTVLTKFSEIQTHVTTFYSKLYQKEKCDSGKQDFFLSFLQNELSDFDRELLNSPMSKSELLKIIRSMAHNKSPGVDGLPIEFYEEHWDLIGDDLLVMYNTALENGRLSDSQRRAVITIIPKSSNVNNINNYRPISLLCVDYKILSKLISERLKLVLHKVIYSKQFCCVPGRSINQCNMEIRDILYYANDVDVELALVNLDWYKAFDLVSVEFTLKALRKLGFGECFVNWISVLYNDIESSVQINNILGSFFPVTRSVRQGCPLSMGLFVVYQEAFYRAMIKSRIIRPLRMPDTTSTLLLGYADDTTILITNEESLVEVLKIVTWFEQATGAILNRNNKTKIFGIGKWKERNQWPIVWLKVEQHYFFTLGVYHSNMYTLSVEKNYSVCIKSINTHRQMLNNRRLTLHQRVVYANSCMLSKIWYLSHIYPLTSNLAKEINKIIFGYVWNGTYEPVRRSTVFRPKYAGGLGIPNCIIKSKIIMLISFIHCNINEEYHNSLMLYYCYIRMHNILPMNYSIHNASISITPYYDMIYSMVRDMYHTPGFPIIANKTLYKAMLPVERSYAETQYPTFNWKRIWSNFCSIIFNPFDKEIIFKHLHLCLATNRRLAMMRQTATGLCDNCSGHWEHTPLHMFYQCESINPLFLWLLRVLHNICNFKPNSNIRFLYFDIVYTNFYQKSICNMFLYMYIITIWKTRKENLRIGILKHMIIRRVIEYLAFLKHMPNHTLEKLLEEISKLNIENLVYI